jgi:hypothetical protein
VKLRLRHNSIRLRLTRSDVDQFQRSGRVEDLVEFPQASLVFSLESSSGAKVIQASFVEGHLAVLVPSEQGQAWVTKAEVGMEGMFQGLSILIEKDWPCLHRGLTEDEDTFARPLAD